jgi:hypothetical protein
MPSLDLLGEVGPAISFRLLKAHNGTEIKFNIPLRAAGSFDFHHAAWRGLTLGPSFTIAKPEVFKKTDLFASLSSNFATQAYTSYFYSVARQYVTATRHSYQASGGYVESSLSVGSVYRLTHWNTQIFTFVSYDSLADATNLNSPLLQKQSEWSGGLIFAWEFLESKTKVGGPH